MKDSRLGRFASSVGLSLALTSLATAVLAIVIKTHAPFRGWVARLTGDYLTMHALFIVLLFVLLGLVLGLMYDWQIKPRVLAVLIVLSLLVSGLIVAILSTG
jgi:hypothetical protein